MVCTFLGIFEHFVHHQSRRKADTGSMARPSARSQPGSVPERLEGAGRGIANYINPENTMAKTGKPSSIRTALSLSLVL